MLPRPFDVYGGMRMLSFQTGYMKIYLGYTFGFLDSLELKNTALKLWKICSLTCVCQFIVWFVCGVPDVFSSYSISATYLLCNVISHPYLLGAESFLGCKSFKSFKIWESTQETHEDVCVLLQPTLLQGGCWLIRPPPNSPIQTLHSFLTIPLPLGHLLAFKLPLSVCQDCRQTHSAA